MKKNEVVVGKRYVTKISGRLTVVEIKSTREVRGYGAGRKTLTRWFAINLKTNREIEIKSAAKLHREASVADVRTYCPDAMTPEVASLVQGLFLRQPGTNVGAIMNPPKKGG